MYEYHTVSRLSEGPLKPMEGPSWLKPSVCTWWATPIYNLAECPRESLECPPIYKACFYRNPRAASWWRTIRHSTGTFRQSTKHLDKYPNKLVVGGWSTSPNGTFRQHNQRVKPPKLQTCLTDGPRVTVECPMIYRTKTREYPVVTWTWRRVGGSASSRLPSFH